MKNHSVRLSCFVCFPLTDLKGCKKEKWSLALNFSKINLEFFYTVHVMQYV